MEAAEIVTVSSIVVASLAAFATVVGIVYGAKWRTTASVEAANAHAWEDTARRQSLELEDLRKELSALRSRLAELEAKPDLGTLLDSLASHDERVTRALERHDTGADRRAAMIVAAIREAGSNE